MSSNVYADQAEVGSVKKASRKPTPQSQPIPGREKEMARNNAGGFTFTLDKWGTLDRFIMLGTESNGYYVTAKDQTKQSFDTIKACVREDGKRTIDRAVMYSTEGRAPKNDPAIVVLAVAAATGDAETQAYAWENLAKVCRIGTHLFTFMSIFNPMGKWNAAAKRGVAAWYLNRSVERAAVQMLKYQSRNGWSHRDVLRLAHVKPANELQTSLFKYATGGELVMGQAVTPLLVTFEQLKRATDVKEVIRLIQDNELVSWEMVPTQWLKDPNVLMALLPKMGLTAVIRQLGKLTAAGVIAPLSEGAKMVIAKLGDAEDLKAQRVHPVSILQSMKQYSVGHGEKGSLTWRPEQRVVDALDDAFYAAFTNVEDTGAGFLLGIDCSGSMFGATVNGSPNLTAAEVAGVMALAIVKRQSNYWIGGFNTKMGELKISPNMRLDKVMAEIRRFPWGGTDCSLPMRHALQHNMSGVDLFCTITDNETWAGVEQPSQSLAKYRGKFGGSAKNVVIGTSVSNFTVADPKDPYSMDIAGFDTAAPQIIAEFARAR